jgi:hypothetical protein
MPLPPGTRLLHIGPHKTGTTALQVALAKARTDLESQGVRYLWGGVRQTNANLAARAVARRSTRKIHGEAAVPSWYWENLVNEVRSSKEYRVVISGEGFADTAAKVVQDIGAQLGVNQTKILITLRPLERILSSQWQQYIQFGTVISPFEDWLRQTLDVFARTEEVKGFWLRHRHDELVRRWGSVFGTSNILVIALNPRDHGLLFRSVEELLGLRESTLVDDGRLINRSLTAPEAEAIRSIYERLQDLELGDLSRHIRYMVSPSELIKRNRVPVGEAKIELPRWALERAREISAEMAQNIARSGARLIGNINDLTPTDPIVAPEHLPALDVVPADLPGWTATGVIIRSGIARGDLPPTPTTSLPTAWLRRATGTQLMREVLRRVRIRLSRTFSRLTRRNDEQAAR